MERQQLKQHEQNEKSNQQIGNIGRHFKQSENVYKYAYGSNEKVSNYDRYEIRQPQQWPRQGCDDPTRIHTLRKYIGQAEAVELATVKATQLE